MPPLLADFIYSSDCKLICEKSLTLPLYFSVDHTNAAEHVLMKILFPLNQ